MYLYLNIITGGPSTRCIQCKRVYFSSSVQFLKVLDGQASERESETLKRYKTPLTATESLAVFKRHSKKDTKDRADKQAHRRISRKRPHADARTHARASEPPRTRADGQTDVWFENDEAATKTSSSALFHPRRRRMIHTYKWGSVTATPW